MTRAPAALLELRGVRFGYAGLPAFLGPSTLSIAGGQSWAIVGPNGAGKSTLLRLMAGLLRPLDGEIRLYGRSLFSMSLGDRARQIGFLPQRAPESQDFTVRDLVLMGRYPHRSMGLFESAEDYRIADEAMQRTGVMEFAHRSMATLSGGQAQRVHLAAVLAQDPDLLLLDEPTAALDIKHQLAVFEILRGLVGNDGPAIVVVTHDVNLAGLFCSHVLLLHEGKQLAAGTPGEVLTADRLGTAYEVELTALSYGDPARQWLVPGQQTKAIGV